MLINADVKGLEVVTAAQLSGDSILCKEILDKIDIHGVNQEAFGLPKRVIAKVLKFRILYGGSEFSFAKDPDFMEVSSSIKFWREVIDKYYAKYTGIAEWHNFLLRQSMEFGYIEIPSGRHYPITPDYSRRNPWPLTIIKNYPVQGFGADLVMLARLEFDRLFTESGLEGEFVCTVHDSLVADVPEKNVLEVAQMLNQAIASVPALCKKVWDYDFKLPLTCEIQVGPNKKDMKDLTL